MSTLEEPKLVTFPAGTTDAEKAESYRKEVRALLDQVCVLRDRARKDGLLIGFNIGWDQYGRSATDVSVVKPL